MIAEDTITCTTKHLTTQFGRMGYLLIICLLSMFTIPSMPQYTDILISFCHLQLRSTFYSIPTCTCTSSLVGGGDGVVKCQMKIMPVATCNKDHSNLLFFGGTQWKLNNVPLFPCARYIMLNLKSRQFNSPGGMKVKRKKVGVLKLSLS